MSTDILFIKDVYEKQYNAILFQTYVMQKMIWRQSSLDEVK